MAGLHGLEICVGGRSWQHESVAAASDAAGALTHALVPVVHAEAGARLEPKGSAVAVHTRGVALERRAALIRQADAVAHPWIADGHLRRLTGIDVVEYVPAAPWTKGDAVRWIGRDVERQTGVPAWVIYFGDDVTDEDAFPASDVSVVVGRRPSAARYRLDTPADVAVVLASLAVTLAAGGVE